MQLIFPIYLNWALCHCIEIHWHLLFILLCIKGKCNFEILSFYFLFSVFAHLQNDLIVITFVIGGLYQIFSVECTRVK